MSIADLVTQYGSQFVASLITTWEITAVSFLLGLALAIVLTIARVSPIRPLRIAVDFYVQVFRNIPGVSLLIIIALALTGLMGKVLWPLVQSSSRFFLTLVGL